jgi:hypothetical protein
MTYLSEMLRLDRLDRKHPDQRAVRNLLVHHLMAYRGEAGLVLQYLQEGDFIMATATLHRLNAQVAQTIAAERASPRPIAILGDGVLPVAG